MESYRKQGSICQAWIVVLLIYYYSFDDIGMLTD